MYVALIIAAVSALVAFARIRLRIEYTKDGFSGAVQILFIKIGFPQKKKKRQRKKKETTNDKKEQEKKKEHGKISEFRAMIKPLFDAAGKLVRTIVIHELTADVIITGDNACETALIYGASFACLGMIAPWIDSLKIKRKNITIAADFQASETKIYLYAYMSLAVWQIAAIAAGFVYQYMKSKKKDKT